jgi:hypothetical protein
MASGLIYLIILGMWGAYFVPKWMSQHDSTSGRATARYKSAMQVVASTPNIPDLLDPAKKLRALRKRQIGAATLLATTLAALIASITGAFSPVLTLVPTTALVIFCVHIRRQVVAAQLKKRRLNALATIMTAQIKIDPSVQISLSPRPIAESVDSLASTEHWIPLADRIESSAITIIPREAGFDPAMELAQQLARTEKLNNGWSPVAVPRPTYATAPKAIRSQRTIDLTVPGAWSAEQERLQALAEPTRDVLFDQELVEQAAVIRDQAANQ